MSILSLVLAFFFIFLMFGWIVPLGLWLDDRDGDRQVSVLMGATTLHGFRWST